MRLGPAVLLLVALVAQPARGDDPGVAALKQIDHGVDAFRAGDYATAKRAFEAAQRLVPSGANAYRWLGLTEVQLADCTRALIDFDRFLQLVPASDERVPEVIRLRNQCLQPAPARVEVVLTAPAPAPAPPPKPLYRRWWLWTTLGVVVAAGVAGVTLGVVLGGAHESRLPPISCAPSTGCKGAM